MSHPKQFGAVAKEMGQPDPPQGDDWSGRLHIGPSNWLIFGESVLSPVGFFSLLMILSGSLGFAAQYAPEILLYPPASLPLIGGQHADSLMFKAGTILFFVNFVRAFFIFVFTGADIDFDEGAIILRSFRGSFSTNTVLLNQVYDCDTISLIRQAAFGAGNLIITTVDGERHLAIWVSDHQRVRRLIVERSGGRTMRAIGAV